MCVPHSHSTLQQGLPMGKVELLELRMGDSCLRTLIQDEGTVPDAMPAPGQPSVTSVPNTSVPLEGTECGACTSP